MSSQINMFLKEQSGLGIHGLTKKTSKPLQKMTQQTYFVVNGALGFIEIIFTSQLRSSYK